MKITEVSVFYSKTVQVKPYEPLKVGLGATATVNEEVGESREEVTKILYDQVKKQLHQLMIPDLKEHGLL